MNPSWGRGAGSARKGPAGSARCPRSGSRHSTSANGCRTCCRPHTAARARRGREDHARAEVAHRRELERSGAGRTARGRDPEGRRGEEEGRHHESDPGPQRGAASDPDEQGHASEHADRVPDDPHDDLLRAVVAPGELRQLRNGPAGLGAGGHRGSIAGERRMDAAPSPIRSHGPEPCRLRSNQRVRTIESNTLTAAQLELPASMKRWCASVS